LARPSSTRCSRCGWQSRHRVRAALFLSPCADLGLTSRHPHAAALLGSYASADPTGRVRVTLALASGGAYAARIAPYLGSAPPLALHVRGAAYAAALRRKRSAAIAASFGAAATGAGGAGRRAGGPLRLADGDDELLFRYPFGEVRFGLLRSLDPSSPVAGGVLLTARIIRILRKGGPGHDPGVRGRPQAARGASMRLLLCFYHAFGFGAVLKSDAVSHIAIRFRRRFKLRFRVYAMAGGRVAQRRSHQRLPEVCAGGPRSSPCTLRIHPSSLAFIAPPPPPCASFCVQRACRRT
jgi:hypothetical protein